MAVLFGDVCFGTLFILVIEQFHVKICGLFRAILSRDVEHKRIEIEHEGHARARAELVTCVDESQEVTIDGHVDRDQLTSEFFWKSGRCVSG
ncbi:hypothetical protein [Corynebacterium dentalis]|uniref:hypothetical protein n=1 Tax=Corynebacterium dentalis TaxID=2014528 RepID=UPI000C079228|nr:hypothetical protein [Corynebacterium dentalis]